MRTKPNKFKLILITIFMMLGLFVAMPLIVFAAPPATPTNLTAKAGVGGITLTWKDNSTNEERFSIYRKAEGTTGWTPVGTVTANTITFLDTTAVEGKTYSYKVQAYLSGAGNGYSGESNEAIVTMTPAKPTNLTATSSSNGITLNWKNNSINADSIQVQVNPGGSSGFSLLEVLPITATTYLHSTAEYGKTYTYRVVAIKNVGGFSDLVTATMAMPSKYTITVTTDGNGTASANKTSAFWGDGVTLTATPKAGYMFEKWQSSTLIVGNYFAMPSSNVTVKAIFVPLPTHNVIVNSGTTNKSKPMAGEVVTISASAAPSGKVFDKWTTSDGITFANSSNPVTTFTMPSKNVTVTATYKDLPVGTYAINLQSDGGGIAKASADYAKSGTSITLTATPNAGYKFKSWQVVSGGVSVSGDKFTMGSSAVTIKALFEKGSYTITVGNGSANNKTAKVGEEVTITANTASVGKMFDKWTSTDGITFADATSMSTTFIMLSKNITVEATYKDLPAGMFAINVLNDGNGTADANVSAAKPGEEITLTIEANEGYHFVKWIVTGGNVTITDNKFIMPEDNVTIEAVFESDSANETLEDKKENKDSFNSLWIVFGVLSVVAIGGGITFIIMRKKEKI